ncbi:MAG: hypothetical protein HND58_14410 [Planctomycetota bacterium]|nr:MAG: hypothetical protein HND58_14410 [Planctomycetota bacterium]
MALTLQRVCAAVVGFTLASSPIVGCQRASEEYNARTALNEEFLQAVNNERWADAVGLLNKGADPNVPVDAGDMPPVILAVMAEDDHVLLKAMLAHEVSLNVVDPFSFGNPLFTAAGEGDEIAAQLLLDAGMEVNARNQNGWTPLMAACALDGDLATVRALLDAGADPALGTPEGRMRPLDLMASSQDREDGDAIVGLLRAAMVAGGGG